MFNNSYLFHILMLIGSFVWSIIIVDAISEGLNSNDWPSINGHIISSSVTRDSSETNELYLLDLEYKYVISNNTFINNDFSAINSKLSKVEASEFISTYKPKAPVTVYYNPTDHNSSYLKVGIDYSILIGLIVIIILFIYSTQRLYRIAKQKRAQS